MIRKIDLKDKAVEALNKIITPKFKLLKTNKIWIEESKGVVEYITFEHGYIMFRKKDGYNMVPRATNGKELIDIIKKIKENKIYSYIETDTQKLKVRPKQT